MLQIAVQCHDFVKLMVKKTQKAPHAILTKFNADVEEDTVKPVLVFLISFHWYIQCIVPKNAGTRHYISNNSIYWVFNC